MSEPVHVFADGACKGNPGPGGWGVLLRFGGVEKQLFGGEAQTTNNRMELMAAIQGLESLQRPCRVQISMDSQYVLKGITEWLPRWIAGGWRTADKKPVKNQDLWQRLHTASQRHEVEWAWVRGHSGHPGNEAADILANRGAAEVMQHIPRIESGAGSMPHRSERTPVRSPSGGSAVQNGTNPHGADLDARSAGRSPNRRDAVSNPAVLSDASRAKRPS